MKNNIKNRILSLIIGLLLINIQLSAQNTEKLYKITVLKFDLPLEPKHKDTPGVAAFIETGLSDFFEGHKKFDILERGEIKKILKEKRILRSTYENNPVYLGLLIGAKFLVYGKISEEIGGINVKIAILQVKTGNIVFDITEKISLDKSPEVASKELIAKISNRLPTAINKIKKQEHLPSVVILTTENKSEIKRLDYLKKIFESIAERVVDESEEFRLLGRKYPGIAMKETELSYNGWVKPSEEILAELANTVVNIRFKEEPTSGISFNETPLNINIELIDQNNNDVKEIKISGKNKDIENLIDKFYKAIKNEFRNRKIDGPLKVDKGNRTMEAAILLKKVIGNTKYNYRPSPNSYRGNGWESVFFDNREESIKTLEKVLYLNPGLDFAHYCLGSYLFPPNRTAQTSIKDMERAAAEFETFLSSNPDMHFFYRACFRLERCYFILGHVYFQEICKMQENNEPEENQKELYKKIRFVADRSMEILKLHCSKMSHWHEDVILIDSPYFFYKEYILNDPEALMKWIDYMEKITYSKKSLSCSRYCAYIHGAEKLLEAGFPGYASKCFDKAISKHGHSKEEYISLLMKINKAKGNTEEVNKLKEVAGKYSHEYLSKIIAKENQVYYDFFDWNIEVPTLDNAPPGLFKKLPNAITKELEKPQNKEMQILLLEEIDGNYLICSAILQELHGRTPSDGKYSRTHSPFNDVQYSLFNKKTGKLIRRLDLSNSRR
jgi:hypothetical protein